MTLETIVNPVGMVLGYSKQASNLYFPKKGVTHGPMYVLANIDKELHSLKPMELALVVSVPKQ